MSEDRAQLGSVLAFLDDPHTLDRTRAGGKAAVLARMRRAGFPVPDGFVIFADTFTAFRDALKDTAQPTVADVLSHPLDPSVRDAIVTAAGRLGGRLAVRSSGVDEDGERASHAGQYSTVLDVTGDDAVVDAVRHCWSSVMSATVREYRSHAGRDGDAPIAVLVQRLVLADAAGVSFTANPVSGARDEILVSAVRGLGEKLVAGEISPDEWVVRGDEIKSTVNQHNALTGEQVREIAAMSRRVAVEMGGPTDLEWAYKGGELFLLQARPITAIAEPDPEPVPIPIQPPPGFWVKDDSHAPVPLLPMTRALLRINSDILGEVCTEFGLLIERVAYETIGGWRYRRIVPVGGKDLPAPPPWVLGVMAQLVPSLRARIRTCVNAMRADLTGQVLDEWWDKQRPEFAERIDVLRRVDLSALSTRELADHVTAVHTLHRDGSAVHFRLLAAISIALGELAIFTTSTLGYDEDRLFGFLSGLSTESTGPARRLAALAGTATARLLGRPPSIAALRDLLNSDREFAEEFQEYRREYGCRALNYELATAALGERPELILSLVCDQIGRQYDPSTATAKAARTRSVAAEQARVELTDPALRQQFDKVLVRAQKAYPVREDNEYWTVSAPNALVRWAALEAAGRLVAAGGLERAEHVFFVELDELREALLDDGDLRQLVHRRRGEHLWSLRNPGAPSYGKPVGPPPSLKKLPPEVQLAMGAFQWSLEHMSDPALAAEQATDSAILKGAAASGGRYTGPTRVVRDETEFDKIRAGDVLVCPITSPVWSVVFPSIGALVTDTGGSLSHAAIIAREYGIPAILATGNATDVLVDGRTVTVDGSAGIVEIHSNDVTE